MNDGMPRRVFLKTAPAAALAFTTMANRIESSEQISARADAVRLEPFDYEGVRLRPSRWQQQVQAGRDFYFSVSDNDILHGFRAAAGLTAPGQPLGGWCGRDSSTVFGQWLSGMARIYRVTGDTAMRNKALRLFTEWAKTVRPDGDTGMRHYPFDKLVCGLVDLQLYADHLEAGAMLDRVTAYAAKNFQRAQLPLADPSHNQHYYGLPQEWYTLAENLYRAYRLTGNPALKTFADEWLYHAYWNKFATSSSPADAHGVHAYSHVNSFNSAAMAYEVTGDKKYLTIVRNAHEYLQRYQCFATGGYGPNERLMAPDGSLGRALDTRSDTCETSCGSWAGFKLSRYLLCFTAEARYGDWMERLLYNGIGAALPIAAGGRNFYYGDYRVGGGMKVYNWDTYTCCSGSYIQNLAEYHNLIYFKDPEALYVNLYLPSEVTWKRPSGDVRLVQETKYPDTDTTTLTISTGAPVQFPLCFRVPAWTRGVSVKINGADTPLEATPGKWATIRRTWTNGDRIDIRIPLTLRMEPVDRQHPDRVAVVRGPVVLVLEGAYHDPNFRLPMRDEELESWLIPEKGTLARGIWAVGAPESDLPQIFRVEPPDKKPVRLRFRPFYEVGENYPYFMYFDRRALPWRLW
jgi:DUF1680 family protein